MKTIQQCLKECDREDIADFYICMYLFEIDYMDPQNNDLTLRDLKDSSKNRIYRLIDRLVGMEPEFDDDRDILMVVHSSGFNLYNDDDIHTIWVRESEVLSGTEEIHTYDYAMTTHARMVSFYVADTYLTQHYLDELIIQFLHEALRMGPEQEQLCELMEKLDKHIYESNNQKSFSDNDAINAIREMEKRTEFQCEVHDKRQESAEIALIQKKKEYDYLCTKIEVEKLRNILKEGKQI